MKIAVIGAGIFGITIGLNLSKYHSVTIYEKENEILTSASRTNQLRLHRGYHYPRSPSTVKELLSSIDFFINEYNSAIVKDNNHYYCIANSESKVSPNQYISFCKKFSLEYNLIENFKYINRDRIGLTVQVVESMLDYQALYKICKSRIKKSNVNLLLNSKFSHKDIKKYDYVINCTYANINHILDEKDRIEYQFEVCEKIVVNMPKEMKKNSIVVMDGPFMCVDPYGRTGYSLLGNVVHAIHHTNTGHFPIIPEKILENLNKGIISNPNVTNFEKFIKSGKDFIPSLSKASYVGSMYTVRSVLPNMDKTDGRPTVIRSGGSNIINVFSGKIDTCVRASKEVIEKLNKAQ